MGLYSRHVFPRLCDWVMSDPSMSELRSEWLAGVGGGVLEVGFATGLNLPHYPEHVRRISTIDPNPGLSRLAHKRIAEGGIAVDQRAADGEELPFDDETFDCVVSTWTLCSIPDAGRALGGVYLVLRPGGRFLFLGHGLAEEPRVQKWQRRLTPSSGSGPAAAGWTSTCRPSSGAVRSPRSGPTDSRWSGCPGRTGPCIGASG